MTRQSSANSNRLSKSGFSLFLIASICLAMLGGCGERVSNHGHVINENELKKINIGMTTKADILEILGQPSFSGVFDTQKLYYSSQVMVQPVASKKHTEQRIIYIFTVDKKNILRSIDLVNKDDGLQIVHIDEKTPTPGDTFGLIEQVFSNLKRRQAIEQ